MEFLSAVKSAFFPELCSLCHQYSRQDICQRCLNQLKFSIQLSNRCIDDVDCHYYALEYSGAIKPLIHQIKFNQNMNLIQPLSDQLIESLSPDLFDDVDAFTWIPSHESRIKTRGFDWISELFLPWLHHHSLAYFEPIERVKKTQSLFDYRKEQRKALMNEAFKWTFYRELDSARVLVFDDILSSGTTMSSYAQLLKSNGAKSIQSFTLANVC